MDDPNVGLGILLWLVLIAIWLVPGFIGARILSGKGHSGCLGFAIGLLGPIGWVIALLVRPTEESEVERQLRIEALKQQSQDLRSPPQRSAEAVFITEETAPDGEVRFRWECDSCGSIGEWEPAEQSAERIGHQHRCGQTVRRRPLTRMEDEPDSPETKREAQGLPDGISLETMRSHYRWKCAKCRRQSIWTDQRRAEADAMSHHCG